MNKNKKNDLTIQTADSSNHFIVLFLPSNMQIILKNEQGTLWFWPAGSSTSVRICKSTIMEVKIQIYKGGWSQVEN